MSARVVPMTDPTDLADEEELELIPDDESPPLGRDDYPFFPAIAQKQRAWIAEKYGNSDNDPRLEIPALQMRLEWVLEGKLPRQKSKPKVALVKDD